MNNLLHLLNSGLLVILFTGFYFVILQHQKSYKLNRIVLLLIPIISLIIPLLSFSIAPNGGLVSYMLNAIEVSESGGLSSGSIFSINYIVVLLFVYFAGIAIHLIKLFIEVAQVVKLIKEGKQQTIHGYSVVVNTKASDVFTFINKIIVPNSDVSKLILQHEIIHVKQMHFIDLFFSELVNCIFWFIPGISYYKKAVVMNHEYSADFYSGVQNNLDAYCEQLLSNTFGINSFASCHTFNNPSITKSRIIMMYKKSTSPFRTLTGYLLIIPFVAFAVLIASGKQDLNQTQSNSLVVSMADEDVVMPQYPGGKEELYKFMGSNVKYPKSAKTSDAEGTVFVSFIVTKSGKIEKAKVVKSVRDDLDAEALRVVNSMPNWIPGTKDGKKVDMEMTLPIKFVLQ